MHFPFAVATSVQPQVMGAPVALVALIDVAAVLRGVSNMTAFAGRALSFKQLMQVLQILLPPLLLMPSPFLPQSSDEGSLRLRLLQRVPHQVRSPVPPVR